MKMLRFLTFGLFFLVTAHANVSSPQLPSQVGNSGKFLSTNGSITSWQTAGGGGGGTPGGATTSVQYNNAGAFAGDAGSFFWNDTQKFLGIDAATPLTGKITIGNTTADNTTPEISMRLSDNPSFGYDFQNEGSATGDLILSAISSGTPTITQRWKRSGAIVLPHYAAGCLQTDASGNVTSVNGSCSSSSGANQQLSNLSGTVAANLSISPTSTTGVQTLGTNANFWGASAISSLVDANNVSAVSLFNRDLTDTSAVISVDWNGRVLRNSSNTTVINWSALTAGTSGFVLQTDGAGNVTWVSPTGGTTPAGSTGDVQFNNAGSFGADNTNFFWDNTNKRLGIGTNTPGHAFHAVGGGSQVLYYGSSASTAAGFELDSTNGVQFVLYADGPNNQGLIGLQSNHPLSFRTNNAARLSISAPGAIQFNTYTAGCLQADASGNLTSVNGSCASGTPSLSSLSAATTTHTIDNTNFAQEWDWNTITTSNAMKLASSTITSGSLLNLTASDAAVTGPLLEVTSSSATSSATDINVDSSGTSGTGININANTASNNVLAFHSQNSATGGATGLQIDNTGTTGAGKGVVVNLASNNANAVGLNITYSAATNAADAIQVNHDTGYGLDIKNHTPNAVAQSIFITNNDTSAAVGNGAEMVFGTSNGSPNKLIAGIAGVDEDNTATYGGAVVLYTTNSGGPTPIEHWRLDRWGHIITKGTIPVLSGTNCGTIQSGSNDVNGKITVGTGATACTVTFANVYTTSPGCYINDESTAAATVQPWTTPSTTTVVLNGTFGAGDVVDYHCEGH
jgi:hypothetical protein